MNAPIKGFKKIVFKHEVGIFLAPSPCANAPVFKHEVGIFLAPSPQPLAPLKRREEITTQTQMDWRCLEKKLRPTLMLVACVGSLSIGPPVSAPDDASVYARSAFFEKPKTQLSVEQLHSSAKAITVKVLSKDILGSGFLIKKQGEVYNVLTNAHVLRAAPPPYRIQTPDGKIYSAYAPKITKFQGNDLALLQFRSPRANHRVASIGSSFTLTSQQKVFAAGFAITNLESQPPLGKFKFTTGKVSLVLDKALSGGYQVGYNNDIRKGMSGGPLLNNAGEVVGVNGKHAYPLWDAPSVFQDGSKACPQLHNLINRTSWAVPMETVVQLLPSSIQITSRLNSKHSPIATRRGRANRQLCS